MQILDNLYKIKDTPISADRLWDLVRHFSLFLRKMKLNLGNVKPNRFSAVSVKQERQFSFVISSVPFVPTDRGTIQFRSPEKPQLFANVTAMDLYSLDTDAQVSRNLPSGISLS